MTFEEKVEFLRKSIKSHDQQLGQLVDKIDNFIDESIQHRKEMNRQIKRLDEQERKHRQAILAAMHSYIQELDEDEEAEAED